MSAQCFSQNSPVFSCATEEHLKWALWGSGEAVWDWDLDRRLVYRSGFAERLGIDVRLIDASDRGLEGLVHPRDLSEYMRTLDTFREGQQDTFTAEFRLRNRSGNYVWVLERGRAVARNGAGRVIRAAGTCQDISPMKLREEQFRLADQVIKSMNEAVVITSLDQEVVGVNRAFSKITEFEEQEVFGRKLSLLHSNRHPETFYEEIMEKVLENGSWHGELWLRQKNGGDNLSWLELSLVRDDRGKAGHLVGVFSDVTERKRVEEKLWHLANYDMLTGLPSRALFNERLEHALRHGKRNKHKVGLVFLDLDHFKHINDSMGHHAGDDLLRNVAKRLRKTVRNDDTVARLGGDEFTIILENIKSREAAGKLARKIIKTLNKPFVIQGQEVGISASVGISVYPEDSRSANKLLQYADTAMYHAKSMGRHNFQYYTERMNQREIRRLRMGNSLRRALERDEFYLVYQPKKSFKTGAITGVEALLRWQNRDLGMIGPIEFIPLAEEMGLIVEIGEWVLREACRQWVRWHKMALKPITMAVNLSAVQFMRTDMVRVISDILEETGMDPTYLELELTESLIMRDTGKTIDILRNLKKLGLSVALDDFGTGYSSLSYLTRFPIDTLKIDKTFISKVTTEPSDAAITNAIIAMAHALRLNIVAEGVETDNQKAYLEDEGCDELQGYLLSKPLEVSDCTAFLRKAG